MENLTQEHFDSLVPITVLHIASDPNYVYFIDINKIAYKVPSAMLENAHTHLQLMKSPKIMTVELLDQMKAKLIAEQETTKAGISLTVDNSSSGCTDCGPTGWKPNASL